MRSNIQMTAEEQESANRLRERLRSPIPMEEFAVESLQEALGRVRQAVLPLVGMPVSDLLLNPGTSLTALVTLKNCAKKLAARQRRPGAEYDMMLALYFAAIASALVFHRQRISSHTDESLTTSFSAIKDWPWMAWELSELFTKATAVLAGKFHLASADGNCSHPALKPETRG